MKHRKVIEKGKLLSGHVPYVSTEENNKTAVVSGGEWVAGSGGGSALPEVTSADNGKVLGVDNAQWKAVNPSEQIVFLSEPEIDPDTGNWSLNKTFSEIMGLILNKHLVYMINPAPEATQIWAITGMGSTTTAFWLIFHCGTNTFTLETTNADSNVFIYVD